MKTLTTYSLAALIISSSLVHAEDTKTETPPSSATKEKVLHQITLKKLDVTMEKTPIYGFSGASNKRNSHDKKWLEIEAVLDIDTVSKSEILPSLDATFTVVYKAGKRDFHKIVRTISYTNVNVEDGKVIIVAYIDPDTLTEITGEKRPSMRDLTGVAVKINTANLYRKPSSVHHLSDLIDHKIKMDKSDKKKVWWDNEGIKLSTHRLLTHLETPFMAARADRYPRVKVKAVVVAKK